MSERPVRRRIVGGGSPAPNDAAEHDDDARPLRDDAASAANDRDAAEEAALARARARLVDSGDAASDDDVTGTLRPRSFDEYVGQEAVVDNLKIAIDAAKRRGDAIEHILFYGPPGLGKTTLAALIAKDLGRALRPTSGPTLERPKDLVGILTSLQEGDVLFIDEIHRLGGVVEEYLYPAMEDFRIDVVLDSGAYAKTYKLPVERFTLIGATTRAGMLSAPLRDRFGLNYHLDYYSADELARIVTRSASVLEIPIEPEGAQTIARRSRGTPRIANRLLRRVRDYAEVRASGTITREVADEALRREGVDELGLDRLDRAFLRTIAEHYGGGPAGIGAIAATLTEDTETLEDVVEPYLLKIGLVVRTASGRKVTARAFEHLGLSRRPDQPRLL